MEVSEFEPPSVGLATRMLANDAIEPTFLPARQRKVSTVDRQHERILEARSIEPVRHDQSYFVAFRRAPSIRLSRSSDATAVP
jgi:hypothetical protein